ncbi:MAG: hypothetical protein B7Z75_11675 [Acidocella sp. 20-57-95]|nr:MAG: hypothetical protein B7Z75_11675 [Acidocella sp. 20-57-95]HQT63140.1 Rieske 2Fe-2S domain-containing protein [Acidocella sp.]
MMRHTVCQVNDVLAGGLLYKTAGRTNIILLRLPSGEIKAIASRCPHHGANLAHGCITGYAAGTGPHDVHLERQGEILRCPWHGFEFDIVTRRAVVESSALSLREFKVVIEGDDVVVEA